jgi:hypothetical protein
MCTRLPGVLLASSLGLALPFMPGLASAGAMTSSGVMAVELRANVGVEVAGYRYYRDDDDGDDDGPVYYAPPRYYVPPPPVPPSVAPPPPAPFYRQPFPPAAYYGPPAYNGPPAYEWLPPPRPPSCGVFRYWNGERCADARYHPPYVGPRW